MRDPSSIARPSLSQCPGVIVRTVKVLCRSVFLAYNKGDFCGMSLPTPCFAEQGIQMRCCHWPGRQLGVSRGC